MRKRRATFMIPLPSSVLKFNLAVVVCLLTLGLCVPIQGQTTATISGTVYDPGKLPIPGATVEIENLDTSISRTTTASSLGAYQVLALAAGTYRVTVSKSGFATEVIEDLRITLDRTVSLDVSMRVGADVQTVDVSAKPSIIDTSTPATGLTILPEEIQNVPLNGRNYLDLLELVPGVAVSPQADPGTDDAVSILGERGNNTGYLIDGLDNTNQLTGGAAAQFNQDTIAEFQVLTSGYKAEFGHSSGGFVNVISRTGANDLHGLASVFLRNNAFDTADIPGRAPYLLRWDYDAALGGAIVKDKVFWFASGERIKQNQQENYLLPAGAPAAIVASETAYGTPSTDDETRFFGKLTETLRKHTLTEEFNYTNAHIGNYLPPAESTNLPSTRQNTGARVLLIGGTDTAILGNQNNPWVVNLSAEFRGEPSSINPAHPQAGPATTWYEFSGYNTFTVFGNDGRVSFGSSETPSNINQKYGNGGANITKVWKRNTFKFGYDYLRTQVDGVEANVQSNQLFATLADYATYGPIDSGVFLLTTTGGVIPADNVIALRNNYNGAYVQDDIRISSKLTVNGGLRWDYDSTFNIKKDFSPRVGVSYSVTPKTVVRASFGVFYDHFRLGIARDVPGFGGANLSTTQPFSFPRLFYGDPTIAPAQEGLCLSETNTDAQIAAAKATCPFFPGTYYGVDHLNNLVAPGNAPIPANSVVNQTNVQALSGLSSAAYLLQADASIGRPAGFFFWGPYGTISTTAYPSGSYPVTVDPSFATPFTRASTLGIQRQVTPDLVVSIDLYHKGIENILGVRQTNIPFAARLTNNFTGSFVNGFGPWFTGKYNSAILSFESRTHQRFTFGGSYAFTSEDDDAYASNLSLSGPGGNLYPTDSFVGIPTVVTDPVSGKTNATGSFIASNGNYVPQAGVFYNGPRLDEGPSDFSLRHILQAHGTAVLPFKFQVSGVFRVQSGYHYTARAAVPLDQDGNQSFNGRDLKTGRNAFTAPHYLDQDLRVSRIFAVGEHLKIQPLFEFFNLFNSANPAAIQNQQGLTTQTFGAVSEYLPGRQGQVGMRVEF